MSVGRSQTRLLQCRTMSRQWRHSEAQCMSELASLLPYPRHVTSKLNKPSVMRLVTTLLKTRRIEEHVGSSLQTMGSIGLMVEAMDGFMLILDDQGIILDVSKHVQTILGHQVHEMLGLSVLDFLHSDDYDLLSTQLNTSQGSGKCEFTWRMKYKTVNKLNKVKTTGYVSLLVRGYMKPVPVCSQHLLVLVCYCFSLLPWTELSYFEASYVVRIDHHNVWSYIDERMKDYVGVDISRQLLGNPMEVMFYPADVPIYLQIVIPSMVKRGSLVGTHLLVTRDGQVFNCVSKDFIVYGPKQEKVGIVGILHMTRVCQEKVKSWPVGKDVLLLGSSFCLPGETPVPMECRISDVLELTNNQLVPQPSKSQPTQHKPSNTTLSEETNDIQPGTQLESSALQNAQDQLFNSRPPSQDGPFCSHPTVQPYNPKSPSHQPKQTSQPEQNPELQLNCINKIQLDRNIRSNITLTHSPLSENYFSPVVCDEDEALPAIALGVNNERGEDRLDGLDVDIHDILDDVLSELPDIHHHTKNIQEDIIIINTENTTRDSTSGSNTDESVLVESLDRRIDSGHSLLSPNFSDCASNNEVELKDTDTSHSDVWQLSSNTDNTSPRETEADVWLSLNDGNSLTFTDMLLLTD